MFKPGLRRGFIYSDCWVDDARLLDSVVDIAGPDPAEDRRRLEEFKRTRQAVPLDEVKAWVASWGSADELPAPQPRKIG